MTEMRKGGNIVLAAPQVEATLRWLEDSETPDVDFLALLLNQSGKVDSDEDLVFYNQDTHPTGKVKLGSRSPGPHASQAMLVDLAGLPDTVARVLLVCSADGGDLSLVDRLHLVIRDRRGGSEIVRFNLTGGGQTALIAGEFYRRHAEWKFRAVDQGYARGLEGLAADYGVHVDGDTTAADRPTQDDNRPSRAAVSAGSDSVEVSMAGAATSDLTLSALVYSAEGELLDLVWFLHPAEFDDAIRLHRSPEAASSVPTGLSIELAELPAEAASIVLTASSFRRQQMSEHPDLTVQFADQRGVQWHSLPVPTSGQDRPSVLLAVLNRVTEQAWSLSPVLNFRTERSGLDLVAAGAQVLR